MQIAHPYGKSSRKYCCKIFIFKMEYGIFQHQKYFGGQLHHGKNQKIEAQKMKITHELHKNSSDQLHY